jgi:hypothetical protein
MSENKVKTETIKKIYLDKDQLYREIVISKAKGKLTRKCEQMLILLANRTVDKMNYRDKNDRNDCLQTALLDIFSNWYLFNEDIFDNPFAYFTELTKRGLARGYNTLFVKKGEDSDYTVKVYSINSLNDGSGMHNI